MTKYLTVKNGQRSHKFKINKRDQSLYNYLVERNLSQKREIAKLWHYYLIAKEFRHQAWSHFWLKKLNKYL